MINKRALWVGVFLILSLVLLPGLVSAGIGYCDKCWVLTNNTETIIIPPETQVAFNGKTDLRVLDDFKADYQNYERSSTKELEKEKLKEKWALTDKQVDKIKEYPVKLYREKCTEGNITEEPICTLVDYSDQLSKQSIDIISDGSFDFSTVPFEDGLILKIGHNTITYTAGTNLITLDDSAGAGDSWGTAYRTSDILSNCGAVTTKQGDSAYYIAARLHFLDGVYFVSENEFVELKPNPINPTYTIDADPGSHIRIGNYDVTNDYSYDGSFWKMYFASCTGNRLDRFDGELLIYGSNWWHDSNAFVDSWNFWGKTRIYDTEMEGTAYISGTDINFQRVTWMGKGGSYDMLLASGYDFAWAGVKSMNSQKGIFMSSTTTSDIDLYDVVLVDNTQDYYESGDYLMRFINSEFDRNKVYVPTARQGLQECYTVNVKVTDGTNPIVGATISLKDAYGTDAFTPEDTVTGGVLTSDKIVKVWWKGYDDLGGIRDYNPFTLKVTKGADETEYEITIDHTISEDIVLLPQATASYDNIMTAIISVNNTALSTNSTLHTKLDSVPSDVWGHPSRTMTAVNWGIFTQWATLQGYIWNTTSRGITGGALSNPGDYKASVGELATQSNISDLETHGDSGWISATGFASLDNITAIRDDISCLNTTANLIRSSQESDFKIRLSDFDSIVAGRIYYAQLNSFNFEGSPHNLSQLPTITIYDALRNKIVDEASFVYSSDGLHTYNYTTLTSAIGGMWESVVTANYSGDIVYLNDWWRISSSPADVEIISITDDTIPTITADVEITNMGTQDSDFEYVYCIVSTQDNKCGGGDDIAYHSGTHYIIAGQVWSTDLTLDVPSTGTYWYKAKAKALGETNWAGASTQFIATEDDGDGGNMHGVYTSRYDDPRGKVWVGSYGVPKEYIGILIIILSILVVIWKKKS